MTSKLVLAAAVTALLFSCSTDPRSMKLSEIQELPEAERKEIMKELNGEEMNYVTRAMLALAFADAEKKKEYMNMTLQEVIDKGEDISK